MLPRHLSRRPETPPEPPKKSLLILSILLIVVGLGSVITSLVLTRTVRSVEAVELSQLQKDHTEKPYTYAKVTAVKYYQFLAAIQNETENYFFVTDPSDRAYIVRISTPDAQQVIDTIANGYAAEMYGIIHEISDELKAEAINGAHALFDNEEISEENFSEYFGTTYLGFGEIPSHPLSSTLASVGTFMTIVGMMFLVFYMNRKLRTREIGLNSKKKKA